MPEIDLLSPIRLVRITTTQETALAATLGINDKGLTWFNTVVGKGAYWSGTAVVYFPADSGGGGSATGIWTEDAASDDAQVIGLRLAEDASTADEFTALLLDLKEDASSGDEFLATIIAANAEDTPTNDLLKADVLTIKSARSGTPDNDFQVDAWTDQASAATNHGNESVLIKGVSSVPGSDQRIGLLMIDLSNFGDWTARDVGGFALTVNLLIANSNLVLASTLSYSVRRTTTKTFIESTVNWNTVLPTQTVLKTGSWSIAAGGGFAAYGLGVTAAQLQPALGKWVLIILTGAGAVPDTYTVKSRDDATNSNCPTIELFLQRGT